ncbi:MAG TPA: CUAEP/CCAEP-tail radical SAM protein [Bryobacteraceae bacterium]|nr:CUAEP/CCAEP-tail radical SAM protein [Bryobacteraceae bacterium]
MQVVLVSTYELGHQPFGLSSPKAWLVRDGHDVVCVDLAVTTLDKAEPAIQAAGLVAFHLPMHTATRLAIPVIERVKQLNPRARLACYGLYAPLNRELLRGLGVEATIGGEFEAALAQLANGDSLAEGGSMPRLAFLTPDRSGLSDLTAYSRLRKNGQKITAGYTEASRGCKHMCRHCPVVPVYQGQFRVVQSEVVLADIRQQVAAGARHITFGDPDFFNGPTHALRVVEAFHAEFPEVSYDATIKIEHLKQHRALLPRLKETGCLFVTSAVESVDDSVLARLEKSHTRQDFFEVAASMREAGLALQPTFIAFTPWTTIDGYGAMLRALAELELVENTAPVQLALRLLVTKNSRLLELPDLRAVLGEFDEKSLVYPWKHADAEVDALASCVFQTVSRRQDQNKSRAEIFGELWELVLRSPAPALPQQLPVPHLDEPWYCCAEPAPQV